MVTLVEKLKEEVGWWSIIVGNSGGMTRWGTSSCEECGYGADRSSGREDRQAEGGEGGGLEGSLNALADALGISPMEVAAVVKPLIPRASLTSIALNPEQTSSSEAVRILFEGSPLNDRADVTRHEFTEKPGGKAAEKSDVN